MAGSRPPAAPSRLPILGLLLANILLSCGPWLVRLARSDGGVGPVAAAFWRLTLALPVLLAATAWRREPLGKGWRTALAVIALGGVAFALDLGAWHVGILRTRLANATLFGNVTALLFPVYGFFAARAWPRPRQMAALLLALAGALLLLGRSYELSSANLVGDLFCMLAGLCYLLYLIAIERIGGRIGPLATLTVAALTGIPVLLGFAIALGEPIRPASWTALALLALMSQLLGQGLILYAISRVPPLLIGLMLFVQPVIATAIGWIVFGERFGPLDAVGAIAILGAMLLVRDDRGPRPLPKPARALT